MTYSHTADEQVRVAALRARTAIIEIARNDPSTFCGYVLKDEQTGKKITQAQMHDEWHDAITRHARLVLWSHVEAGKTQQISIGRTLFELGRNPNTRIAIVSNTAEQAKKIIRTIAQYITESEELRAVFPRLAPNPNRNLPWTSTSLTVDRTVIGKDPSVQAFGMHGNVTGARLDHVFLDDILDPENTSTEKQMQDGWTWVQQALMGRLSSLSQMCFIGNAWHPHDAMHRAAALPRFTSLVYSLFVDEEKETVRWPDRWPKERVHRTRLDLGPLEFARQLLCRARDDDQAKFKQKWVDQAIEAGDGYSLLTELRDLPNGFALFGGVDLSIGKSLGKGDLSVFCILLLHPDGTRQILNMESGRLTGPEIVARIEDLNRRYGCIFIVENNAAQHYIIQFARDLGPASIVPFTTGKNKVDPRFGIEGVAAELAGGKWIIPSRDGKVFDKDLAMFVEGMLYYDPKGHTSDHLMAVWFAREGARAFERGGRNKDDADGVGCRVIG